MPNISAVDRWRKSVIVDESYVRRLRICSPSIICTRLDLFFRIGLCPLSSASLSTVLSIGSFPDSTGSLLRHSHDAKNSGMWNDCFSPWRHRTTRAACRVLHSHFFTQTLQILQPGNMLCRFQISRQILSKYSINLLIFQGFHVIIS